MPTYIALGNTTLTSAQTTVTFSSISSGYENYEVLVSAKHTTSNTLLAYYVNGNSGSGAWFRNMSDVDGTAGFGNYTAATSQSSSQNLGIATSGSLPDASSHPYSVCVARLVINNPRTAKIQVSGRAYFSKGSATADDRYYWTANRYNAEEGTFSSLTFTAVGGTFAVGSTFSLFGMS